MRNIFTEHPHSLNKTYWEHLSHALTAGREMITEREMVSGGIKAIIHGFFPFVLEAPEKPPEAGDPSTVAHSS